MAKTTRIKKKNTIIICSIFFGLLLLVLAFFLFFVPKLTLEGDKVIEISYGNNYEEPGYKAKYLGNDITDKVWINSNLDVSKTGTYEIKYKVKKNKITATKIRTVKVIDDKKPELVLTGEIELNVCPNFEYEEEGYQAVDNYDGDLTEKVKVEKQYEKIDYIVEDSSGNKTVVTRKTNRVDEEGPTISLKGGDNYYVFTGSTYKEPGYQATDNCDGDLTSKVSVSGTVDTKKEGKYKVTYTVKDTKGNETKKERIVTVSKEIKTADPIKGAVYLTFDDGPSKTITPALLDLLKKKNVKATFFVINHSSDLDYLIKREFDEGHTVALHSYSHDYATIYKSTTAYFNDLDKIAKKVENITGTRPMIMRFPGGSSNTVSRHYCTGIMSTLVKEVQARGYHYFDWNVSSGDAGDVQTKEAVYKNVTNGLSKSRPNVILMHDFESNYKTLNALSDIIDYAKANGYEFYTIDMTTSMVKHGVNN